MTVKWMTLALMMLSLPAMAEPLGSSVAAVGRITSGEKGGCTGVLIEPDLVLTAAHCMIDPDRKVRLPGTLMFRTGAYDDQPSEARAVVAVTLHPVYRSLPKNTLRSIVYDAALLRLSADIDPEVVAPLPFGDAALPGEILHFVSWPIEPDEHARERTCPVIDIEAPLTILECTLIGGESGGAVLRTASGKPELVAVMSSRSVEGATPTAYALNADARVGQIKAIMPLGSGGN